MLPRLVRRCLLVVLLALLAGLLPPAPTQAVPIPPRTPARASAPAIPLDELPTGRLPAPPEDAASSALPASVAEAVAEAVEPSHQSAGFFDGGFNAQERTLAAVIAGPIVVPSTHPEAQESILVATIPAFAHDSFSVDLTLTRGTLWTSRARVRLSAAGTTPPTDSITILEAGAGSGTLTAAMDVIVGANVPITQPMELRLTCEHPWLQTTCTFANFRFYRTQDTWRRLPVTGPADHAVSHARVEVMASPFGAIPPDAEQDGGPFLAFGITSLLDPAPGGFHIYSLGHLAFPALTPTDVVTASMRYGFERVDAGTQPPPVILGFRTPDPSPHEFLSATDTDATVGFHGWRTAASQDLAGDVSGTTQELVVVHRTWGWDSHRVGIDRITFYLNGKPFAVPLDQTCGVCTPPQLAVGKPINTFLGNEFLTATDLAVASGGLPLAFERTYTSFLTSTTNYTQTTLGPGWRHGAAASLTRPEQLGGEDGVVIYEAASGQRYRFVDAGGGAYQAVPGVHATLAWTGTQYVLTMAGQATQEFDVQGRLTAQADAQGHRQTISYGTSGAAAGQPIRVTDLSTSRSLSMTYTTLGSPVNAVRLRTVADDLQRTVTFTHSATTGDLIAVSALSGGETRYAYDSQHQLTAVWQPWNDEAAPDEENTYTNGRVTRQEWANGTVVTLSYSTNPTTLEQTTTITTTGVGVAPTVEQHIYRADGTLRYTTRNGLFTGYTTWNGALAPNAMVDGAGTISRQQTTSMGLPTRVTDALGHDAAVTYDRTNHPLQVIASDGITTTLTYGPSGTLTETLRRGADGTQLRSGATYDATTKRVRTQTSPDGVVTWFDYDTKGQVTTQVAYHGTTAAITTTYAYDAIGRVTDVTIGAGTSLARTTHTTYRPDGQVATVTENYLSGQPATASQNVMTTYGYDSLGRRVWTQTADGVYHGMTRYNDAGQVLWTVENPVNGSGVPTVPSGTTPPTFSASRPDANVATLYGYDGFGRTILVTQTGILTGGFDLTTKAFTATTTRTTRTEYDLLGRPVTTTLNYRPGLPLNLRDVNVQTYTYYDGAGNVTWQSDPLGRWTRTEYDALNRPVTTTLNYENGNPLTVSSGVTWTMGVDTDIKTVMIYDEQGQVAQRIDNYVNGMWTVTEPLTDRVTFLQYDGLGRPITATLNYAPGAVASGINRETVTRYDATTGRVVGTRDVMGHWSIPQYDAVGRSAGHIQNCRTSGGVASLTSCASWTSAHPDRNVPGSVPTYDALGRASQSTNALNVVMRTTYDPLGRATGTIQNYAAGQPTTAITNVTTLTTYHDALGKRTTATDPTGVTTSQQANALGQTVVITDSAGLVTRVGYDGTGMQRWVQGPDGAVTVTRIDGLGRPIATIANYEDGVVGVSEPADQDLITATGYDIAGRRIASVDPLGRITRYAYDLQDRLITVTENELDAGCTSGRTDCNLVTTYHYDRAGNQTRVTDARNVVIRQAAYNAASEAITTTDALGMETAWIRDQRGQVGEQAMPTAVPSYEIYTGYDALGRMIWRDSNDLHDYQTWTYDILGRPVAFFDEDMGLSAAGTTTTTYDPLGRVSVAAQPTGTIRSWYDAAGRRIELNPDLTETNYSYDSAGRPDTVVYGTGAALMADYGYDSAGRLATTTNADGSVTTTSYDAVGRITDLHTVRSSTTITRFQYTYDRAGQRTQLVETVNGATRTLIYGYDGVGRLTAEAVMGGTTTGYTYDTAGNRLSVVVNSTTVQSFTYNAASQVTNSGYTYDDQGNLLTDGTNTYYYDLFNRLQAVATPNGTPIFDYSGEVLQRITRTGQPTVTLIQDTSQGLSKLVFQTVAGGNDTTFVHGAFGEYLGSYNGIAYPVFKDAVGTVRQVVNDSGTVIDTTQYSAWGEVQSGDAPNPYGFAGEYTDATSGLVYLRARWYNPKTGTLLGRDPFEGYAETPYSLHPYQYGYSNPLTNTDPSGRSPMGGAPTELCENIAARMMESYNSLPQDTIVKGVPPAVMVACVIPMLAGATQLTPGIAALISALGPSMSALVVGLAPYLVMVGGAVCVTAVGMGLWYLLGWWASEVMAGKPYSHLNQAKPLPFPQGVPAGIGAPTGVSNPGIYQPPQLLPLPTFNTLPQTQPQPQPAPAVPQATTGTDQDAACNPTAMRTWMATLPTRVPPNQDPEYNYQRRIARTINIVNGIGYEGEYTVPVPPGGSRPNIQADSLHAETCSFVEVKYVGNINSSPFIGNAPSFIDTPMLTYEDEVDRYTLTIAARTTPVRGLRVVTNTDLAVPNLQRVLTSRGTPNASVEVIP